MSENNVDKIIALFTALLNKTKGDILPILNKESWDSWAEFIQNSKKLTDDAYAEFGKFLCTARELVIGADGMFSPDDEERLIKEAAEVINIKVDIPVAPEFVERKVFEFLLNSAYKLAKEKFKSSPQLMGVYNALAKELSQG